MSGCVPSPVAVNRRLVNPHFAVAFSASVPTRRISTAVAAATSVRAWRRRTCEDNTQGS